MKIETCENCGVEIGQLEKAYIYENRVTCKKCYAKLKDEIKESPSSGVTKPGKV
jgi:protein-arginine kinase activator protein McsA